MFGGRNGRFGTSGSNVGTQDELKGIIFPKYIISFQHVTLIDLTIAALCRHGQREQQIQGHHKSILLAWSSQI